MPCSFFGTRFQMILYNYHSAVQRHRVLLWRPLIEDISLDRTAYQPLQYFRGSRYTNPRQPTTAPRDLIISYHIIIISYPSYHILVGCAFCVAGSFACLLVARTGRFVIMICDEPYSKRVLLWNSLRKNRYITSTTDPAKENVDLTCFSACNHSFLSLMTLFDLLCL